MILGLSATDAIMLCIGLIGALHILRGAIAMKMREEKQLDRKQKPSKHLDPNAPRILDLD